MATDNHNSLKLVNNNRRRTDAQPDYDELGAARGVIWGVLGSVVLIPILWIVAVTVISIVQAVFGS
jgi:hypothetical protein